MVFLNTSGDLWLLPYLWSRSHLDTSGESWLLPYLWSRLASEYQQWNMIIAISMIKVGIWIPAVNHDCCHIYDQGRIWIIAVNHDCCHIYDQGRHHHNVKILIKASFIVVTLSLHNSTESLILVINFFILDIKFPHTTFFVTLLIVLNNEKSSLLLLLYPKCSSLRNDLSINLNLSDHVCFLRENMTSNMTVKKESMFYLWWHNLLDMIEIRSKGYLEEYIVLSL